MLLTYEPLSKENLPDVVGLSYLAWPDDFKTQDSPEGAYLASLYPDKHQDFWERSQLKTLEYFAVKDIAGNVVGVTGLYTEKIETPDIVWLGWYSVHPLYRGKGYGRAILQWTIDEAKHRGFKIMRLYTGDDAAEATAQIVYEKFGFKEIAREKKEGDSYTTLYKELIF